MDAPDTKQIVAIFVRLLETPGKRSKSDREILEELEERIAGLATTYFALRPTDPSTVGAAALAIFLTLDRCGFGRSPQKLTTALEYVRAPIVDHLEPGVYAFLATKVIQRYAAIAWARRGEPVGPDRILFSDFRGAATERSTLDRLQSDPLAFFTQSLESIAQAHVSYFEFVSGAIQSLLSEAGRLGPAASNLQEVNNNLILHAPAVSAGVVAGVYETCRDNVTMFASISAAVLREQLKFAQAVFDSGAREELGADFEFARSIATLVIDIVDEALGDEDFAREIGVFVGKAMVQDQIGRLRDASGSFTFAYVLGTLIAPTLVNVILSAATGGATLAAKAPKLAKQVQNLSERSAKSGNRVAQALQDAATSPKQSAARKPASGAINKATKRRDDLSANGPVNTSKGAAKADPATSIIKAIKREIIDNTKLSKAEQAALEKVSPEEWKDLIAIAKTYVKPYRHSTGKDRKRVVDTVKGSVFELFIRTLPEFDELIAKSIIIAKRAGFNTDVKFTTNLKDVVRSSNGRGGGLKALSDGIIYATKPGTDEVLVIAVIESKSKSVAIKLAKETGSVVGQFDRTIARIETGDIVLLGTRVLADDIKRPADFGIKTPILGVVPKEMEVSKINRLKARLKQGRNRDVEIALNPLSSGTAFRIARRVIETLSKVSG